MKIIVTHMSPDLDAITSVWVIKRYLPGWEEAAVEFVPAGTRSQRVKNNPDFETSPILTLQKDEIIHVDTGLGPLDHHQTPDQDTCGAKRSWDYVVEQRSKADQPIKENVHEATARIVNLVVQYDHFQEVYRPEADADYQDLSLFGINEGLQYKKPGEDDYVVEFVSTCLDYLLSHFENKVWAENELKNGIEFETKYGKALGIESINTSVIKLAQKRGYVLVACKDSRRGHVSIKTLPNKASGDGGISRGMDLTLAYEQLKKMDTEATWFLHVSKKMLLNGSTKNPDMKPTTLSLEQLIRVLEKTYG